MRKTKSFIISDNKRRAGFLAFCVIPSAVLYLMFMIYPAMNVFTTSVYNWSGLSSSKEFVGFKNFATLFHDEKFWMSFKNTIFLMLVVTVMTMATALFLAYTLTQSKLRERNLYRILFFFPNVLSIVVIGDSVYKYLFSKYRSSEQYAKSNRTWKLVSRMVGRKRNCSLGSGTSYGLAGCGILYGHVSCGDGFYISRTL